MSSSKCAKCEQTVYHVEGLRCLDKIWHKGCFKCHECGMTLNMKNYKGFEKRPYCNAHCPQAKATTVADTPEIRRLAENTRIQSQAKYHEDFEKSKGKGFTAIADDPETLRIKETSKIISNVAYHGELERKKQMEEKRGRGGPEDSPVSISSNNNNNSSIDVNNVTSKYPNNIQVINVPHKQATDGADASSYAIHHQGQNQNAQNHQQYQRQLQQQQRQQQQLQLQKQQQLQQQLQHEKHKQQQVNQHPAQQPMHFAQDLNIPPNLGRQSLPADSLQLSQHQLSSMKQHMQQYPVGQHAYQQQQQMALRQQQMQQQQQQHLMLQQHRQSSEPNLPLSRQPIKHAAANQQHHQQQLIKQQQAISSLQQQMKYAQINDQMMHRAPAHLVGQTRHPHMVGVMPNGQRLASANQGPIIHGGPQGAHHMIRGGFNPYHQQVAHTNNGELANAMPKQPPILINSQQPQRHMIHPSHMQQLHHQQQQVRPANIPHLAPNHLPGRVFRAIYDYMANDVDEVSFFENDILVDCVNVDRNWLIGKVARSGETGMLPANYVAELPSQ